MKLFKILLLLFLPVPLSAQFEMKSDRHFTHADTLIGMLRPERTCIDVKHYDLDLTININEKTISGSVIMSYVVVENSEKIQIDLYNNMIIDSIIYNGNTCKYIRDNNAVFVDVPEQLPGSSAKLTTFYHGKPLIAKRPPWDGGFVWKKDKAKKSWIGVACEDAGASLWWPCKDHFSDKPDSVTISMTTPDTLSCIANGKMTNKESISNNQTKYTWKVSYPINLYNVTFYIGDYYLIEDSYSDFKNNKLDIKYWIIGKKFFVAKLHFRMVANMLHGFEHYFGPFPFFKDGYTLVEAPYLGMEHQSAIAYGNNYMRGYQGERIPDDQSFDYIVLHESAHEYWGNRVSADDRGELWIHEAFTTYCESLYLEWIQNYTKAVEYLNYQKPWINNKYPILGPRNVNFTDFYDGDMYYKGSWILHSLRNTVGKDSLWFAYLKDLYQHFSGKITNTKEIVSFTNNYFNYDYTPFFQQFLMNAELPVLEYIVEKKDKGIKFAYRWNAKIVGFDMPVKLGNGEKYWRIRPTTKWKYVILNEITTDNLKLDSSSFLYDTLKLEKKNE